MPATAPSTEFASPPARFQAHAPDLVERAFQLWSTVAGRNAALTASLLAREADADLRHTSARTLAELRAGWLGALSLAQHTLVAGLVGDLDELPHAGAARLKSAELVLKTLQHANATIVPSEHAVMPPEDDAQLSLDQRVRRARAQLIAENAAG